MIKLFLSPKKLLLVLFVAFIGLINFGCQKENPINPESNVNSDIPVYDGHTHASLVINQICNGEVKQILESPEFFAWYSESYDSGILPFETGEGEDFEIIENEWWAFNPLATHTMYVTFYIYNTHWHQPQQLAVIYFATSGSNSNHTYNWGNYANLVQNWPDYGYRIVITSSNDGDSKIKKEISNNE